MTGPYVIERAVSPADIDQILKVEEASFTNPWTREMYVNEMQNEGVSFVLVARNTAGEVIGFCSFWHVFDELHINNLAVRPLDRRTGVATALLQGALDEGVRLGAARATLEVRRSNDAARRLYERFGFTIGGVRSGYYSHPVEDALVLWLERIPRA